MELFRRLLRLGPGFIGQALTFASLLMPVVAGQLDAVAMLVGVSAAGNIAAWSGSLVFVGLYPSIGRGRDARVGMGASLTSLLIVGVIIGAATLCVHLIFSPLTGPTALVGAYTLVQGVYFVALGTLIRQGRPQRISRFRLVYGLGLAVYTTIACSLFATFTAGLTLATILALFSSTVWCALSDHRRWRMLLAGAWNSTMHERKNYVRARWKAIVGGLISTLGLQGASLAVVGLGHLAAAWAVIIRVAGGFGTVGQNVLGPIVQAPLACSVRANDVPGMRKANLTGIRFGLALAILALVCSGGLLIVGNAFNRMNQNESIILSAVGAVYIFTTVLVSPVSNNLLLLGLESQALMLGTVRLLAVAAAALIMIPELRLVIFALAEAFVQVSYLVLTRGHFRRVTQSASRRPVSERFSERRAARAAAQGIDRL